MLKMKHLVVMTQVLTNVIYAPKIENNTVEIGHFMHKCKFSTFIIIDGYRHRINRNSIKVIISLNLSASNKKHYIIIKK